MIRWEGEAPAEKRSQTGNTDTHPFYHPLLLLQGDCMNCCWTALLSVGCGNLHVVSISLPKDLQAPPQRAKMVAVESCSAGKRYEEITCHLVTDLAGRGVWGE